VNKHKNYTFEHLLDLLPGIWCVVDTESRYIYYNKNYAELVGVSDKPDDYLLGKTVADMHCNASLCASIFWQVDALVKSTKKTVRVLHSIQMADGWKILQIDKKPILNADGEVQAIIFNLIDQSANHMLDLALYISRNGKQLDKSPDGELLNLSRLPAAVDLKPRESECLFYLTRGFSYKEIARVQNVAYRTIVDHIERLKTKFNASTTIELISKALSHGYPGSVPQQFFQNQFSIIISTHD